MEVVRFAESSRKTYKCITQTALYPYSAVAIDLKMGAAGCLMGNLHTHRKECRDKVILQSLQISDGKRYERIFKLFSQLAQISNS